MTSADLLRSILQCSMVKILVRGPFCVRFVSLFDRLSNKLDPCLGSRALAIAHGPSAG